MRKLSSSRGLVDVEEHDAPPEVVLAIFAWFLEYPVMIGVAEKNSVGDLTICRLDIGSVPDDCAKVVAEWKKEWPTTKFVQSPSSEFQGRDLAEIPLRLWLTGTPFQRAVWHALLEIPHGRTMTYGEIAMRLGKPKAARAVGMACGANPIPLIVPCHRVIAANGGMGGYSGRGGAVFKRELLACESA